MTRRLLIVFAGAVALLAGAGSPAWAHQEISPATVPTGTPIFLTFHTANETRADLNRVTLTAPADLEFGAATRNPTGWTAARTAAVITWTGGAVKPSSFESWGFELEGIDQPGPIRFKATLGYADGTSADAEVALTARAPAAADDSEADGGGGDGGDALGTAGLVVALVALGAAVVAIVQGRRRDGEPRGAAVPSGQDW